MSLLATLAHRWETTGEPRLLHGVTRIEGAEWLDRVRRAAGWLQVHGVRAGDRVALQVPREPAFLEVHLAALALGVSTLPLNPRLTAAELEHVLDDAVPRLRVLVDPALVAGASAVPAEVLRAELDASEAVGLPGIDGGLPPSDGAEALLCYTSGTTGRPKGAPLQHRHLAACVTALHDAWRFSPDDVLVHALPLFHIHGLVVAQHVALWAGATTVWLDGFDAGGVVRAIAEHRATVFMGVPTFYQRLLALPAAPPLPSMRLWTSGSAPLPAASHRAFAGRFGHAVLERYGMTEIGIVLSNPYEGERVPGAVGLPLPGVEARIVGPDGVEVGPGEVGELLIRGPSVFEGYLHRPDATEVALAGGWMHTGDLGHRDERGYVYLVGRRTDLVLVGGFNVYPAEVEGALREHPDVEDAAVVGIPDPDLGERVVASVVARRPVSTDSLCALARERLSAYKVPRHVALVRELPRNAMGKVQKDVVREDWQQVVVEPAVSDDAPRIAAGNVALALETEQLVLNAAVALAGSLAVFNRTDARYVVARIHGLPVGQAMITTEWSDWRDREVWWLQSVWVEPEWRGRGVFRAIWDHVLTGARAQGAAGVRLYVDRRNTHASAIYDHLGLVGDHYDCFELMLSPGGA